MSSQTKFIRSHRERVRAANDMIKKWPEKVGYIDREAFVEFFLLEDIVRLCEWRLNNITKNASASQTRAGTMSAVNAERTTRATLYTVREARDVAKTKINMGNFSDVWKAIPEGALMRAAGSPKYMEQMRQMVTKLLGELSEEALEAVQAIIDHDEALNELEDHERNTLSYKGLSVEEFNEITNPSEVIEAEDVTGTPNTNKGNKTNPNIN